MLPSPPLKKLQSQTRATLKENRKSLQKFLKRRTNTKRSRLFTPNEDKN